ncbi:hypothetical protein TWF694_005325 [Orbilia ellipsospora]|uniref:F-box domain-containing protein n=1 Tax=Orbilia ellipsospora TaxID=2528407 RepID=A0AAV9WSR2_9PEZI
MDTNGASAVANQADAKILVLPTEIQTHILSFLSFGSLVYASMTCKLWEEIATAVIPTERLKYRTEDYDTFHELAGSMEDGEMAIVYRVQGDDIRICRPIPSEEAFNDALGDFEDRCSEIPLIDITECKFLDDLVMGPRMRKKTIQWRWDMRSPKEEYHFAEYESTEVTPETTIRDFAKHMVQVFRWYMFEPEEQFKELQDMWKAGVPFHIEFYNYEVVETTPNLDGETEWIYLSFFVSWILNDDYDYEFLPIKDLLS